MPANIFLMHKILISLSDFLLAQQKQITSLNIALLCHLSKHAQYYNVWQVQPTTYRGVLIYMAG